MRIEVLGGHGGSGEGNESVCISEGDQIGLIVLEGRRDGTVRGIECQEGG